MNVHSLRYAVRTLIGPWVVLLATVLEVLNFFQRGMPWRGETLWTVDRFLGDVERLKILVDQHVSFASEVRSGCRWNQLPREYGHYRAVQGQLHRWRTSGVMEEVLEALANFPSTPLVVEDLTPPLKLTGTLIPELLLGLDPHSAESSRRPRLPGQGARAAWLTLSVSA
ncbi:transposase [Streptomyces zaomyceticus]|uniref:Insertion element IS402-like domain-containing protein n=1 Tax=Streptomyces zaomyceticus TaxID=68286 RepID=A0ABZ1L7F7_9ACTN|nr:hypothetical protein OG237_33905 [Streptomyces zaomyceticus]